MPLRMDRHLLRENRFLLRKSGTPKHRKGLVAERSYETSELAEVVGALGTGMRQGLGYAPGPREKLVVDLLQIRYKCLLYLLE